MKLLSKIMACLLYGMVSLLQTLNSRYLFRTLGFNFYSFAFMVQRILNVALFSWNIKWPRKQYLKYLIPYTLIMCSINILSSFCVTIMPLAAFMAFKKFIVLFVLIVGFIIKQPNNFNWLQYSCISGIVFGGILVGEKEILKGEFVGYVASLFYTLFEATAVQYAAFLYLKKDIEPQELFLSNSLLSIPYYFAIICYENEFAAIWQYFSTGVTLPFAGSFLSMIMLACMSQLSSNFIAMKISPFEKATVANIKDLLLTLISVKYFKDFELTSVSQIGIVLCLFASLLFSVSLLYKEKQKAPYEAVDAIEEEGMFQEQQTLEIGN